MTTTKKHPVYAAFFYSSKTDINNRDFNNVGIFVPILNDASEQDQQKAISRTIRLEQYLK